VRWLHIAAASVASLRSVIMMTSVMVMPVIGLLLSRVVEFHRLREKVLSVHFLNRSSGVLLITELYEAIAFGISSHGVNNDLGL